MRALEHLAQQVPHLLLHGRRQQVAGLGASPRFAHELAERALMLIDLLRIGLLRQIGQTRLELLVQRDVVVHPLPEVREHLRVGVYPLLRQDGLCPRRKAGAQQGCGERSRQHQTPSFPTGGHVDEHMRKRCR